MKLRDLVFQAHFMIASCLLRNRELSNILRRSTSTLLSHSSTDEKDNHYMQLALRHAQHSFRELEVPIGAVIVDEAGRVLATSRNRVETTRDVTTHAEIDCIRKASTLKNNWRLLNCTLYTTLEPCPMCMGAIQSSRLKRLVYGAKDSRLGACGSFVDLTVQHPFHDIEIRGNVKAEESGILLRRFFQLRRKEQMASSRNFPIYRASNFNDDIETAVIDVPL